VEMVVGVYKLLLPLTFFLSQHRTSFAFVPKKMQNRHDCACFLLSKRRQDLAYAVLCAFPSK
jgi:hypothetical protein